MTPQELKNSILQLAIQGKLVEQRPEEGTAEELYQLLQVKKQHLIKEGKIKKEKSLSEITEDETPFDIPESWKWVRVADCISNRSGLSYKKENLGIKSDNMVRVLRGGNILDMNYCHKPDDVMIASQFVNTELFLKKNTIITPAVTSIEHIGKMGRIEKDYEDTVVGGFVLMLTPHFFEDTFSKFLLYVFSSRYFRDCCRGIVNKSGQAFYNLSREKMMYICIPLPPLAEQKRIVAKIEELLPYIERYEKAWNKLEELNKRFPSDLHKSILQLAIQGKLVEQRPEEGTAEELYQQIQAEKQRLIKEGKIKKEKPLPEITEDEIPFDIPESWFWTKIESVTYTVGNRENQIQTKEILPEGDFPVVSQGQSLIDGYTNQREKVIHNLPLVMFGDHTRNVKYIDFPFVIGADGTKFHKCILVYPKFLYYWMIYASGQLRNRGYARHYVLLKQQLIPLPPLAEQKRIVAKIEELMPLCEKLKRD